jgi:hypothetical protein
MFELTEKTKAKLVEVAVLSQKNRKPDETPGAKLTIEMELANHALIHFDPRLRGVMFEKANGGGQLDGVDAVSDLPSLTQIGAKLGTFKWAHDLTGYGFTVIYGTGRRDSNIAIEDCKLSGWRITGKEGGTVVLKFNVESANVTEGQFGKLAHLKARDIELTLTPPDANEQADLAGE